MRRVIDGDTIELSDGQVVRYIGIDTPEIRRKVGGRWVEDIQPMAIEARQFNQKLVEGKHVRLEYDVQRYDRFGRLLAYVYVSVGENSSDHKELMVNAELLRVGLAQLLTITPDVRYVELFRSLAEEARRSNRGLWGRR